MKIQKGRRGGPGPFNQGRRNRGIKGWQGQRRGFGAPLDEAGRWRFDTAGQEKRGRGTN